MSKPKKKKKKKKKLSKKKGRVRAEKSASQTAGGRWWRGDSDIKEDGKVASCVQLRWRSFVACYLEHDQTVRMMQKWPKVTTI